MDRKDKAQSRRTLLLMAALILMLLIGIATRWGYIKQELSDTWKHYLDRMEYDSLTRKP